MPQPGARSERTSMEALTLACAGAEALVGVAGIIVDQHKSFHYDASFEDALAARGGSATEVRTSRLVSTCVRNPTVTTLGRKTS